jgi:hypothetical protein
MQNATPSLELILKAMFQAQFNLSVGESVFVCALNYSILE